MYPNTIVNNIIILAQSSKGKAGGSMVHARMPSEMYIIGLSRSRYAVSGEALYNCFQVNWYPPKNHIGNTTRIHKLLIEAISLVRLVVSSAKKP